MGNCASSKPDLMFCFPLLHRIMKCVTWIKDSHGLFNYESNEIIKEEFEIKGNTRVVRTGVIVNAISAEENAESFNGPETKELTKVGLYKDSYWVYDPCTSLQKSSRESLFLVLRNYISEDGQPGVKIKQGDIIKLGRCTFLIKEVVRGSISPQEVNLTIKEDHKATANDIDVDAILNIDLKDDFLNKKLNADINKKAECEHLSSSQSSERDQKDEEKKNEAVPPVTDNEVKCRICLGEENTKENPIISSPCKCLGSIKYIHADCLQHWLKSKVVENKSRFCFSYCWKEFECDVCKTKYPGITYLYPRNNCAT